MMHAKRPRGMWCVTEGDCGVGQVHLGFDEGVQMWDHCEMPPPDTVYEGTSCACMSVCVFFVCVCESCDHV